MGSATQPILCCIGDSVAGKPTQFVMERAFRQLRLDWQVITVEVETNCFAAAVEGMRAMKFAAARFFTPFDSLAVGLLCEGCPITQFVGSVTSARYRDGQWDCWNGVGFGIVTSAMEEVAAGTASPALLPVVWLYGDSLRMRSCYAAAAELGFAGKILWSDGPPASDLEAIFNGSPELLKATTCVASGEATLTELSAEPVEAEELPPLLIIDDGSTHRQTEQFDLLNQLSDRGPTTLFADRRHQARWGPLPATPWRLVSELEQSVMSEVYDFYRWTGQRPQAGSIREAYEEYLDF